MKTLKIASIIPVKMKSESNFKFPPSVKLEKLSLKKSNSENKPGKKTHQDVKKVKLEGLMGVGEMTQGLGALAP